MKKRFLKTAPIFLFHRIATVSNDPVSLCITPTTFENQIKLLSKNYKIISLSELSDRIGNKKLIGNEAAITFDDGYRDNYTNALPILEKYDVPATIFITTGMLGKKAGFEWDMEYKIEDRAEFLNTEDIKKLSANRLITIGAHTHTHPRLSDLSEAEQRENILMSKKILEEITGQKITSFAYPFGRIHDYSKTTKKIVEDSGFDFAYTNISTLAASSKNRYSIPRLNVQESTINQLMRKL